ADGDYGEKEVEQIRVLTPGAFEIHQRDKKGQMEVVEEGTTSLDYIPFAVAYSNRVNVFESRPPLSDIAELNLKAYQIQSDLDNIMHVSNVPMLAFFGFPSAAEEVSAGPGEAIAFPAEGRAEYISPNPASFDASFKRLDQIEKQINDLGLSAVLGQKLSAETAEAKRLDRSQGDSTMMTLLIQLADGEVLGDDFEVEAELEATQNGGLIEMQQPEPEASPEMPEASAESNQEDEIPA
ncbi:MAG: DUF4055 domain-containing protein, partial [Marivivens sp.]|nr:DUF4055 domain-containing protein [Marivivens sp.]